MNALAHEATTTHVACPKSIKLIIIGDFKKPNRYYAIIIEVVQAVNVVTKKTVLKKSIDNDDNCWIAEIVSVNATVVLLSSLRRCSFC